MALDTSCAVIRWSKTIFDRLAFGEDEFVIFKPAVPARGGCYRLVHAFLDWSALDAETVEEVVSFGVHVGGRRFGCTLTGDRIGRAQRYEERDREENQSQ